MSMFLPEGFDPTGGPGGSSSPTDFGSADPQSSTDDVALMQRVLAAAAQNPSLIPESFMGYMLDWLQISKLQIPIAQVPGYAKSVNSIVSTAVAQALASQFASFVASDGATARFNNTTYGSPNVLGSAGPTISSLADGSYIVGWGASFTGDRNGAGGISWMAVSVNGAAPLTVELECDFQGPHSSLASFDVVTVATGGANSFTVQYKNQLGAGHEGDARGRWLVALKFA